MDARAEQRSRLLGVKLRALVEAHLGGVLPDDAPTATFPSGTALRVGSAAWVLVDGDAAGVLGRALAWSRRSGAESLAVVAELGGGQLARRARHFAMPIEVWYPDGRTLLPAVPTALDPPPPPNDAHLHWVPLIEAAGAEPVVEHGVVTGEVRGLEVCRVVDEPTHGALADVDELIAEELARTARDERDTSVERGTDAETAPPGAILEVGVGAADRQAFALLHGDVPTPDALREVVDTVRSRRAPDAPAHPLNRLCRERALRWSLCRDPGVLGMADLVASEPPLARRTLREVAPCVATGRTGDGRRAVVVCSVGVDLDLAPYVADVIDHQQVTAADELVVVLPERDAVPISRELLDLLDRPVGVITR